MLKGMFELLSNIIALVMNPITLLLFLILFKQLRKERKKGSNEFWVRQQGRGA
jgi:hypothetical protein